MRGWKRVPSGLLCAAVMLWAFTSVSAYHEAPTRQSDSWFRNRNIQTANALQSQAGGRASRGDLVAGRRLFERETFGGNGRTCETCHSQETGTVSPTDAQQRFLRNRRDPLFVHDGSDDENGDGIGDNRHATRMLENATVLMRIPLHPNVTLANNPSARVVTVIRGIPTTLNTPALDNVLMVDGRQPDLESQALGAITDHAQATRPVPRQQLEQIAKFQQLTSRFFTSLAVETFSHGGPAPQLPQGLTASERRGRTFFEDVPPDFSVVPPNFKVGACAACHSGPMLNQTNQFLPLPLPPGSRFQTVLVSEFNAAGNPVIDFVFHNQANDVLDGNPDGIIELSSPDPGRALITGRADDTATFTFDHANAFKISPLRGIRKTAPYFHDNSAKTLEDVLDHYQLFFLIVSDPDGPGPEEPLIQLTEQDKQDIIAFLKLLN